MTDTIKIACRIPNGIMLRLWKEGFDDGTGFKPMIADGLGVRLNGPSALHTGTGDTARSDVAPAVTEIDAAFWSAWLAQNQQNPLVEMDQVCVHAEEDETSADPFRADDGEKPKAGPAAGDSDA